jgi:hypothetical protein
MWQIFKRGNGTTATNKARQNIPPLQRTVGQVTALETLQKYGLKMDVKSIRERLYNPDNYFRELKTTLSNTIDGTIKAMNAEDIVHDADLALLCELAEKGEIIINETPASVLAELECQRTHFEAHGASTGGIDLIENYIRELIVKAEKTKEVYILMSPEGGICLRLNGVGTCYDSLAVAEKAVESKNKWSKKKGYGVFELVTLEVK